MELELETLEYKKLPVLETLALCVRNPVKVDLFDVW